MALTRNTPKSKILSDFEEFPVKAAAHIYDGAAVSLNSSGYANPLVAGEDFIGIADGEADNSVGSAGDINTSLLQKGKIVIPSITGASATTVNDAVYASDDGTFTMTATDNSLIGYLRRYSSSGCVVELQVKNG